MNPRRELRPVDLLRAALDDAFVADVVTALGAVPDDVRVTLEMRWLDSATGLDVDDVLWRGIRIEPLLAALRPATEGRRADVPALTDGARDVLLRALREAVGSRVPAGSGHLLLGLIASKDPLVAPTLREHGLRLREARALVHRWGRRVR